MYRENPAQIHRIMPWVRREVTCLMNTTTALRDEACQAIIDCLPLISIQSPSFRRRLVRFLGAKTLHFIHELNNFARSPYDMYGYDRAVRYSPRIQMEDVIAEFSLSDSSANNDDIIVSEERRRYPQMSSVAFTTASAATSTVTSTSAISSAILSPGMAISLSISSPSSQSPISVQSSSSSVSIMPTDCTRTTITGTSRNTHISISNGNLLNI